MVDISWCKKQAKGIRLINPSDNLSDDYMKRADLDLDALNNTTGHWKLITAYYACYDILYSLMMKSGIKSEIHDCTIELMNLFNFSDDDIHFMKRIKNDRIQVQYYLKDIALEDENQVKKFIITVKKRISDITKDEIMDIRKELERR